MTLEKKIYELHHEHQEWLNKLSFYKDDLAVMQNRINEVAAKNTSSKVMIMVEHFQNQIVIQKEQIDILNHEINEHESLIKESVAQNATAVDHRTLPDHSEHREKIERFEELFAALRKELMNFLSKVL